jgi:acid-sensing ion channel, other
MENGYKPDAPLQTFPFRALGVGVQMGISLDLAVHVRHFNNSCKSKAQGFKMVLHAPSEIPQLTKYFQKLPIEHEVIVTVRPEMMTTDEDLQNYKPMM